VAKISNKIYIVTGKDPNRSLNKYPKNHSYWSDILVVVIAATKAKAAEAFRGIYECTSRHPVKVRPIGYFAFWDGVRGKSLGGAYDSGNEGVNFGAGDGKTFVHTGDGVRELKNGFWMAPKERAKLRKAGKTFPRNSHGI
jgi:hypothetical protein